LEIGNNEHVERKPEVCIYGVINVIVILFIIIFVVFVLLLLLLLYLSETAIVTSLNGY